MTDPGAHPDVAQLAGLIGDGAELAELPPHVRDCAQCRADVQLLRALPARLAALPPPVLPAHVAARLHAAIRLAEPARAGRARRPALLAAAAVLLVAVLGGAALLLGGGGQAPPSSSSAAGSRAQVPAYTRAALPAQARDLVAGASAAPPLPLAGAQAPGGARPSPLTGCLRALGMLGSPLATAAGTFEGRPVLLVVLPAGPGRLDALLVGPGCATGQPDLRYAVKGISAP